MLEFNWLVILATSLVPLLVGMIYYSGHVMGNAWMKASGMTAADAQGVNMIKISLYTLLMGLFLAVFMIPATLHINHVFSLISQPGGGPPDPNSAGYADAMAFISKYGGNFRTFKHGAFHGIISALFCAWPVIAVASFFERKSWRYIAVHLGYWVLCFAIMGGIVCAYGLK